MTHNTVILPSRMVLPLEFHENIPFLQGKLDGKPCKLLLDSGAPHITLNAARIPADKLTSGVELMGAAGKMKSYRTRFRELSFGEWRMGPMEVLALNEAGLEEAFGFPYHGLIGFRQLLNYDWMVDYQSGELHLWESFHKEEHPLEGESRIRYLNHLPLVEAMVDDVKVSLLVDTGCSGLVFDTEMYDSLETHLENIQEDELQGAGGLKHSVSSAEIKGFRIGEKLFPKTSIQFSDISLLKERIGDFDGIIGFPLLGHARTVVSWEQKRLFFLQD